MGASPEVQRKRGQQEQAFRRHGHQAGLMKGGWTGGQSVGRGAVSRSGGAVSRASGASGGAATWGGLALRHGLVRSEGVALG